MYKTIKPVSSSGIKLEKRELKIGVSNDGSSGDNKIFKGLVDDIVVYNRALTDYEIGHIYNQYNINQKLNFNDSQIKDHLINSDYKITQLKNQIQNLKQKKQALKSVMYY